MWGGTSFSGQRAESVVIKHNKTEKLKTKNNPKLIWQQFWLPKIALCYNSAALGPLLALGECREEAFV